MMSPAEEVAQEDAATKTLEVRGTEAGSTSTKVSMGQEKGSSEVAGAAGRRGTQPQDQPTRQANGDRGLGWHCVKQ